MLYFPNSRVAVSAEFPIAAGASVTAEGCALVSDNTGGVFGVKPSTGAAGDNFMGVAVSQQLPLSLFPKVEERVQPVTDIITLAKTPTGTVLVYNATTSAVLVVTTNYTISGKTITMNAAFRGNLIRVFYKYTPTAVEARAIQGDTYPGGAAGSSLGQVGILRSGTIYTTEYDQTVDWQQATPTVRVAANGLFTIGGSGAIVNCAVVQAPNTTNPYLGLLLK
jgi:hypothetical protein